VAEVREAIDNGNDIPTRVSIHAIAETLTSFLAALAQPVIPADMYPAAEVEEANLRAVGRKFLESLPTLNYNVFVYLVSFLREILSEREANGSSAEAYKTLCLECCTGSRLDDLASRDELLRRETRAQYMSNVVYYFLTADEF
jgi:phosphatidylinositol-bisphosphatase